MDAQPTNDKRTKRRFIPIVTVVGVLVLVIVGVVVASGSIKQPVGVTFLPSNKPRTTTFTVTNRTDEQVLVSVWPQFRVDEWQDYHFSVDAILAPHTNATMFVDRPDEASRLHLLVYRFLPGGIAGFLPRIRAHWWWTQRVSNSQRLNPFVGPQLSPPRHYFVPVDLPTNSDSLNGTNSTNHN